MSTSSLAESDIGNASPEPSISKEILLHELSEYHMQQWENNIRLQKLEDTLSISSYSSDEDKAVVVKDAQLVQLESNLYSNQPHPLLDSPMLYFFIKWFPQILELYKSLHERRWTMSYRLQRYVPGVLHFRKSKMYVTIAEVILLCPFILLVAGGFATTFVYPSTLISGTMSRYAIILALAFAQRNSLLTLLLGIPVDRGLQFHKISGYVAFITGLLHACAYAMDPNQVRGPFNGSMNISGSGIIISVTIMVITAYPIIRRKLFELFYYVHITCLIGIACCTFYHSGLPVPILVICIWGVDIFIRSIIMARCIYPRKATLKTISNSVTEISFPKTRNFCYNPGQYVYLAIPELSHLQWHPFSIATAPSDDFVRFYVRRTGSWTKALFDLAERKHEVDILMEGPYGNLSVDLIKDRKYKNVMLISGGIGGTFVLLFIILNIKTHI
jgi:predicted ferric reductase